MTRLPAANKAYRAQPKPDHKLMTTTYPWNLLHQGICNKSPRPSHARCLAQWSCSPTFSTRELFGKISFGLSHSIGVWRQVSYERCCCAPWSVAKQTRPSVDVMLQRCSGFCGQYRSSGQPLAELKAPQSFWPEGVKDDEFPIRRYLFRGLPFWAFCST